MARALADIVTMTSVETPVPQPALLEVESAPSALPLTVASHPTASQIQEPAPHTALPTSNPVVEVAELGPIVTPEGVAFGDEVEVPAVEFDKDPTGTPSPLPTATSTATMVESPTATSTATMEPSTATSTATMVEPPTATSTATMVQLPSATAFPIAPPTMTPSPGVPPPIALEPASGTTLLLLGIDARPGEGWVARSDALMVVRLDPDHNRIAVLSLPRDLWVAIPGAGEDKINNAYFRGEQAGSGMALAKQTVGNILRIPIDYAVVIDFDGFRGVIDTLGGVPVDVPRDLYDPQFPTIDYGYTVAQFTAGSQTMDGERALMFSRIRHPDSDFERMRRQQLVMQGIAQRIRELGALETLQTADQLTAALRPFVRSDIPFPLALNLLWSMRSVEASQVQRMTADHSLLTEANVGGAYALLDGNGVLPALGAQLVATP